MTADERLVLQTTIVLHGFELYERWWADSGFWTPALVGRQLGEGAVECIPTGKDGSPWSMRVSMPLVTHIERLHWVKLQDWQLRAFYNTVVTTC
jgi:hypothetical protein